MDIIPIAGHTRVLGKAQGYMAMPIKDEIFADSDVENHQIHIMSGWFKPTVEELSMILAGGVIEVSILGTTLSLGHGVLDHIRAGSGWPPIIVKVGPIPK
jgi:hypothetical protein